MGNNTNTKGGFWMMVEKLDAEPINDNAGNDTAEKQDLLDDDFFPDTSF